MAKAITERTVFGCMRRGERENIGSGQTHELQIKFNEQVVKRRINNFIVVVPFSSRSPRSVCPVFFRWSPFFFVAAASPLFSSVCFILKHKMCLAIVELMFCIGVTKLNYFVFCTQKKKERKGKEWILLVSRCVLNALFVTHSAIWGFQSFSFLFLCFFFCSSPKF